MNDRWRDEIVWKQNACLGRRSGVMDRDQAVYLSLPSLSTSVFSCSDGARLAFAITQKYQPLLFSWLLLWLHFFPCSYFLQGRRSYLRMCKDEWTYLLEQKCPNTMWLQDHKSAIVNLGETKLLTARIYLSCANDQLTAEKWSRSFSVFISQWIL